LSFSLQSVSNQRKVGYYFFPEIMLLNHSLTTAYTILKTLKYFWRFLIFPKVIFSIISIVLYDLEKVEHICSVST
jgi:hypothetical protein